MSIEGDLNGIWDVSIKTPIGTLAVEYVFAPGAGGLSGVATLKGDTVPLRNIVVDGPRVSWQQTVTNPMRLNLDFDVLIDGDALTGHSKAGRLPRAAVSGLRRS